MTTLLLFGDITQRATATQFAAGRAFVDSLAVPVCLAVPGNHDIPRFDLTRWLLRCHASYPQAFGAGLGMARPHGKAGPRPVPTW